MEWSSGRCDRECLKSVLLGGSSEAQIADIIPPRQNCVSIFHLAKRYLSPVIHFAHWDEEGVFRTLFPQHHLALIHHEARIDATSTCLLAGVLV